MDDLSATLYEAITGYILWFIVQKTKNVCSIALNYIAHFMIAELRL